MEFLTVNVDHNSLLANLGCYIGDTFIIADDCEETLEEIINILVVEDSSKCYLRRQCALREIITKALVPLVTHSEEDSMVFRLTVRLFSELTQPLELIRPGDVPHHPTSSLVEKEIDQLVVSARKAFKNSTFVANFLNRLYTILKQNPSDEITKEDLAVMNHGVLLLRNILGFQDANSGLERNLADSQDILGVLFKHGLKDYIIDLSRHPKQEAWCVGLIQLIVFIFKGQRMVDMLDVVTQYVSEEDEEYCMETESPQEEVQFWDYLSAFTVEFLEKAFNSLVVCCKSVILFTDHYPKNMTDMYLMWTLAHFLQLCRRYDTAFSKIRDCLSVDMMTYLVYAGVTSCEELLLTIRNGKDTEQIAQRNHLAVTGIQEIFNMLSYYMTHCQDEEELQVIQTNKKMLCQMDDLRLLFLLLIRHHKPQAQSLQQLGDVVMANHSYLLLAESCLQDDVNSNFDMLKHISLFATREVMNQYGCLLEHFEDNSPIINECIFTMMHHVAGDCGKGEALLQLRILKQFTIIWDKCQELTPECYDLMEYIVHEFLMLAGQEPRHCAELLFGNQLHVEDSLQSLSIVAAQSWTGEELDELFQVCIGNEIEADIIMKATAALAEKGYMRSPIEIALQLAVQGQVEEEHVVNLLSMEEGTGLELISQEEKKDAECETIESLVSRLQEKQETKHLAWLQRQLLEICYVQLGGRTVAQGERQYPEEPVALHYTLMQKSVPLIPYTEEQEKILQDPLFQQLLHKLGFHFAEDVGQIFPRVPHFWNPEDLLSKAKLLGEVEEESLKFSQENASQKTVHTDIGSGGVNVDCSKQGSLRGLWTMFVKQCNLHNGQKLVGMAIAGN